jgi:hypothetical protein
MVLNIAQPPLGQSQRIASISNADRIGIIEYRGQLNCPLTLSEILLELPPTTLSALSEGVMLAATARHQAHNECH